ncbi:hypothetical protein BD410DRAFT_282474 [Rickenella mellea]|uniref:F-box domain-containing protein n=1 Tax=Rickenella mellea TaxID=50990 RepID=A0A4Y7Q2J7_9AGAM|nr:hypothetical protein BD410DRAFT_282474 [Rickenella mellea]
MYFPVTYNREVIPPEIVLNILLHASPLDLLRVQITSRYFRDILEANQHLWRLARKSLNPPVPDPVLPKEMYGRQANWSESAYANHVFGRSNCSFCGDSVDHLWVRSYYSLRQIVCIKGECRSAKHRYRVIHSALRIHDGLHFVQGSHSASEAEGWSTVVYTSATVLLAVRARRNRDPSALQPNADSEGQGRG